MLLNREDYRDKVLGCWLGKNIGGTLGAPFEWRRQVNNVSFYTQDLGGEPLPNDDLDLQLLWLVALEERGLAIDAHTLAEYWLLYVTPHWSEYGTAKVNLRAGLMPPWSGIANNPYKNSCGAFIRSEIWACIAPGCPRVAARYAYEDAIVDHGDGEGVYAEVFCAALESAAFGVSDVRALFDIGLSYIPENCGVAGAVRNAMASYDSGKTWRDARDALLADYRGSTHGGQVWCTSEEDQAKGFHEGVLGWDAPSNIGIIALALLYGKGDFGESLCTAVNCGEDTDCTAATVGSVFGILYGAKAIPEKWIAPIGRTIKTACLNLGELGYFGNQLPATVDDMTDRTERIALQVLARNGHHGALTATNPTQAAGAKPGELMAGPLREELYRNARATVFRFDFFTVAVDYGESPSISQGIPKFLGVAISNTYKISATIELKWHVPEGWTVSPCKEAVVHVKQNPWQSRKRIDFTVEAGHVDRPSAGLVLELRIMGRPTVMLVPVTLLNGNVEA
jgi:ADP-ribosylglycohydrolase